MVIIHTLFSYTKTVEETMKAGLRGGCDLDCGSFYSKNGQVIFNDYSIVQAELYTRFNTQACMYVCMYNS